MKLLSYILFPLSIGGAVYSLYYQPHKRLEKKKPEKNFKRDIFSYTIHFNFNLSYKMSCFYIILVSFFFSVFSWYSWSIASLANGVYAFGFLLMLPQLFLNYRLKSVAHLPWRVGWNFRLIIRIYCVLFLDLKKKYKNI